jgi:hypothetical protein
VGAGVLLLTCMRVGLLDLDMMCIVDVASCGSYKEDSSCLNDSGSTAVSMRASHYIYITVVHGARQV